MASEAPAAAVNGASSQAAMLEEKHSRDQEHQATVEEVEDEAENRSLASVPKDKADVISEATTPARTATQSPALGARTAPVFDVRSEELFPALGAGPKPRAAAAMAWGSKPASVTANGPSSGPQPAGRFLHISFDGAVWFGLFCSRK